MLVWAFGDGDYGKLGIGSNAAEMRPVAVEKLTNLGIKKVAAGTQFSVALSKSGVVFSWGQGTVLCVFSEAEVETESEMTCIAVTDRLTGHSDSVRFTNQPQPVAALSGHFIDDISVGAEHTLAVTSNGDVFGWGNNEIGRASCRERV